MNNQEQLVQNYINAWATTDNAKRTELIARTYAPDAVFYAMSPNGPIQLHGHDAIAANIANINERDIQGKGLTIELVGFKSNHNVLIVSWNMKAADKAVMTGMDTLLLDESGRIAHDYIFIG